MDDDELLYMDPRDVFDPCIRGVGQRFNSRFVIYDRACIISRLMYDGIDGIDDPMSEELAEEYFEFNVVGAWVGDATPAYLEPLIEEET